MLPPAGSTPALSHLYFFSIPTLCHLHPIPPPFIPSPLNLFSILSHSTLSHPHSIQTIRYPTTTLFHLHSIPPHPIPHLRYPTPTLFHHYPIPHPAYSISTLSHPHPTPSPPYPTPTLFHTFSNFYCKYATQST